MTAPAVAATMISWLQANFQDLTGLTLIGQGGQKLVFAAGHPTDGDVVLKVLQPNHSVEDVRREILAVQNVQSPRVPRVFDHGSLDTTMGTAYWIREQRIHGETLREMIVRGVTLAPVQVLRLAKQILGALVNAEAVNIVHRDVKPDNIMQDPSGQYWLLDFGLARHLTLDSLTATALPFGKFTWGYAPQEQCRNDKPAIDARADLFALAITLYETSTGNNPFRTGATGAFEMLRRIETETLPPLRLQLVKSGEFANFVAAISQRRRDHRPPTARDALVWLEEICEAEGV